MEWIIGLIVGVFLSTGIIFHVMMIQEIRDSRRRHAALDKERKNLQELAKHGMFVLSKGGQA
jgi:hypothetical protein